MVSSLAAWLPADPGRLLSPARFDRYVASAGNAAAAAELYVWNTRISGAWHERLGTFEVVLRNALNDQLAWISSSSRIAAVLEDRP